MAKPTAIDNAFYDTIGEAWYNGENVAMSILRREAGFKNAWMLRHIQDTLGAERVALADVGCGGGFVANFMAEQSYRVAGVDLSPRSLLVARAHDRTASVRYVQGDACQLPFESGAFAVVCLMDVLEHLEDPGRCLAEASRVLRPGGLVFFQTFNRTPLAWVFFMWAVNRMPGASPHTHVYRLFITPRELEAHCARGGLAIRELTGFKVAVTRASLKAVVGRYDEIDAFQYQLTPSLAGGYLGMARKTA